MNCKNLISLAINSMIVALHSVSYVSCRSFNEVTPDIVRANQLQFVVPPQNLCSIIKTVAPDFCLENVDGVKVCLSDFKGKWVILYFWHAESLWSRNDFKRQINGYNQNNREYEVVAVDCSNSKEIWSSTLNELGSFGIQLYCPHPSELTLLYNVEVFPTKYIIDPEGNIVFGITGAWDFFDRILNVFLEYNVNH